MILLCGGVCYVVLFSRVGKGISPQASHRTVLDSLPSYGSSVDSQYENLPTNMVVFVTTSYQAATPFAPLPLQEFHNYYEVVRHLMKYRYSVLYFYVLELFS